MAIEANNCVFQADILAVEWGKGFVESTPLDEIGEVAEGWSRLIWLSSRDRKSRNDVVADAGEFLGFIGI